MKNESKQDKDERWKMKDDDNEDDDDDNWTIDDTDLV